MVFRNKGSYNKTFISVIIKNNKKWKTYLI